MKSGETVDYCLLTVDRLSGVVEAIPCQKKGLTAQDVAHLFLEKCVCYMGVLLEFLSDTDNLITSDFFRMMF